MRRFAVLAGLGLVCAGAPALAHHSIAAMYDREKTVQVQGVLSKFELQNPHSLLEVIGSDAGGKSVVWTLESGGVGRMSRMGFDKGSVAIGDKVVIKGSPAREGGRQLWLTSLETGGKTYDFNFGRGQGFGAP